MFNYVKESYNELVNKVTWPTFPQLQSSTIVVMVASVIFAIVVLAMDLTFENLMAVIYKTLGNLGDRKSVVWKECRSRWAPYH